ncbi:MAG: hypothetical protein FJ315_09450, partial [SAR202 cluster bacterium]|nr:hypothetical protein [SAR202 cluster bacterium]
MNKRDVPGYWAAGFLATAVAMIVAACGGGEATATRPASPQATRPPATAVPRATAVATSTPAPAATPTPAVTAIPAGRQPRYGGVLRLRDIRDWAAWDSYNALSGFVPWYSNVLNGLVFYDQDDVTRLIPDAAERWEVSADGKTVTFFLRKDMNWQDGRPFTADDVVYNLERGRKGEGRVNFNRRRLEQVDQVQKVDDKTVKVTLKRASASFMDGMGTVYMMMYPAHVPDMQVFKERPVGTGAFQFKRWQQ